MSNVTANFVKSQTASQQGVVANACKKMVINLLVKHPELRSLMVTSCAPGDGATTVVSFLAKYLAESMGRRVLLIDANFDNPALPSVFAPRGSVQGLTPVSTENPKIDLITKDALVSATGRVFDSTEFKSALAKLASQYDTILIDAAAATVCPDTMLLGPQVDGVVLVVQAEKTRRQVAEKAKEDLEAVGARLLGAILNQRMHVIPDFMYRYV